MLTVVKILSLMSKGFGLCLKYIYVCMYVRRDYEIKAKSLQTVPFGVILMYVSDDSVYII